jgi:hypothetical protein
MHGLKTADATVRHGGYDTATAAREVENRAARCNKIDLAQAGLPLGRAKREGRPR